jgi:hypothetical protein
VERAVAKSPLMNTDKHRYKQLPRTAILPGAIGDSSLIRGRKFSNRSGFSRHSAFLLCLYLCSSVFICGDFA